MKKMSIEARIEELLDKKQEEQLEEKIRERLLEIGRGKQTGKKTMKHYRKMWRNCIEPVEQIRRTRKMRGLDGWYCGLGQLVDWTDPEIYAALPYLLTSYMYNFYLQTERESLYLDSRWASGDVLVQDFLVACREKNVDDKELFYVTDVYLPRKGIGELFLGNEYSTDCFVEGPKSRRKIEYLARDFTFPEMKRYATFPNDSIGWVPEWFRQDVEGIAKKLGKPEGEVEKALYVRDCEESITLSGFQDIYITWFRIFDEHREMFGKKLKLDPVLNTVLFYKNFCDKDGDKDGPKERQKERLIERLRVMGVESEDDIESASEKIRHVLLGRYDRMAVLDEQIKFMQRVERQSKVDAAILKKIEDGEASPEDEEKLEKRLAEEEKLHELNRERSELLPIKKILKITPEEERKEEEEEAELQKRVEEWIAEQ